MVELLVPPVALPCDRGKRGGVANKGRSEVRNPWESVFLHQRKDRFDHRARVVGRWGCQVHAGDTGEFGDGGAPCGAALRSVSCIGLDQTGRPGEKEDGVDGRVLLPRRERIAHHLGVGENGELHSGLVDVRDVVGVEVPPRRPNLADFFQDPVDRPGAPAVPVNRLGERGPLVDENGDLREREWAMQRVDVRDGLFRLADVFQSAAVHARCTAVSSFPNQPDPIKSNR